MPPQDGGEAIQINELMDYLGKHGMAYDVAVLKKAVNADSVQTVPLGPGSCPPEQESYQLEISEDNMTVTVRFYPPSETGQRMSMDEFLKDMEFKRLFME